MIAEVRYFFPVRQLRADATATEAASVFHRSMERVRHAHLDLLLHRNGAAICTRSHEGCSHLLLPLGGAKHHAYRRLPCCQPAPRTSRTYNRKNGKEITVIFTDVIECVIGPLCNQLFQY